MTRKTADVVADQVGRIDQYNDLRREAGLSSYLMAYADSSTTTLKVLINEGNAYFGGTMVEFAGGYSPEIVDTTASSRIDVLSFKSNNSITRTAGVEADSPTAPAIPAGEVPICSIYMRKSATSIEDDDDTVNGYIYKDLRGNLDKYNNNPVSYKIGLTSRVLDAVTNNEVIAHGLGRIPKIVRIRVTASKSPNAWYAESYGIYDGVVTKCVFGGITYTNASNSGSSTTNIIHIQTQGSLIAHATITMDATNITLAWTRDASDASAGAGIIWEVE